MSIRLRPIALATTVLLCGTFLLLGIRSRWFLPRPNTIRELASLPIGTVVRLRGIVTYADPRGKRLWVQDDTGAVAIEQDVRAYAVGRVIEIQGTKTQPFDPLRGIASVGLANLEIAPVEVRWDMPAPVISSLRTLPENEKTGIRIQITGVVRQVTQDPLGRVQLTFADAGREVALTLSKVKGDPSRWLDAKVRMVGIGESSFNENGGLLAQHLWAQNDGDIQVLEMPPRQTPVHSIRSLYSDADAIIGHRIRIRGWIAARLSPTSVLFGDEWGVIACETEKATSVAFGRMVEVSGFPTIDGLRIDLRHCLLTELEAAGPPNSGRQAIADLTTIAAVRALSAEQASKALPVNIAGVVTYNDPQWRHLFIQDATGGIYVKYSGSLVELAQGERIAVRGITNPGDFAPVIVAARFVDLGKGKLPQSITLKPENALAGTLDSRLVEVEGVIHPMKLGEETSHLTFELYSPFAQVHVYTGPNFASLPYLHELEDAKVRARGVLSTIFNSRRQLVGINLSISSPQDIQILKAASKNPFGSPTVPVSHLLRYSPNADFTHRIKVQGSVTMIGRGLFYLQDNSGGVEVQSATRDLRVGDVAEAVGYATVSGSYSPILTDAVVRVVRHDAAVQAKAVTPESLLQGQDDAQLVSVDGRLVSVVDTLYGKSLVLQSGGTTFDARLETPDSMAPMPDLQPGSLLRLTGVCSAKIDSAKLYLLVLHDPVGFTILLRSREDMREIEPASWWNVQHTMAVLSVVLTTMIAALIWITYLRRRVRRQTEALKTAREKAEAVAQLAAAMQEVTTGKDYSSRVPVRGGDDIRQLCQGFNRMLTELEIRENVAREAEAQLAHQALTDDLTGLPNRRLLADRLTQSLAVGRRDHHSVSLLYMDLDGFKLVNDSLGHSIGDALLGEVARRLRSRLRESDTLARLGGDEFTVILNHLRDSEAADEVARKLLEAIGQPYVINGHEITISASIGISFFPENAVDADQLLQQADSAMYAAKRNGKNQVMHFTPTLGSSVRERLNLENQLRTAIARGEISVHYQPEFDLRTHRLVRFEALARWNHTTLGPISPIRFIPIAEESGLIIPLGAYIMERACTEAVNWQTISAEPIQVAVNVSSLQFARDSFVDEVAEVLRHTGLRPGLLQIELTESVMLSGAERAAQTMKRLRALDISLAIDDFGTGYSCLSYLPKLPFNALKVDRSFINELEIRPETKAMVNSLVTLAHNLDMQVIVEGVETTQQLDLIKALGANEVQGFLLGRPSPDPAAQILASRTQASAGQAKFAAKAGAEKR